MSISVQDGGFWGGDTVCGGEGACGDGVTGVEFGGGPGSGIETGGGVGAGEGAGAGGGTEGPIPPPPPLPPQPYSTMTNEKAAMKPAILKIRKRI